MGFQTFKKRILVDQRELEVLVACGYADGLVQDLLHRAKFQGELAIVDTLADLLVAKFGGVLATKNCILTYVPPDPNRWLERNYHLPQMLAKKLSVKLGLACNPLFSKTKHTQSQVEIDREARLTSLEGVFELVGEIEQPVDKLWIIDDITTTGATLKEAYRALREHYPEVKPRGLVVAG